MSRNHVISTTVLLGLAVASAAPAWACAVWHPPATLEQAKQAKQPGLGLVGRITATYFADETRKDGESIVRVNVTQDFTGKLPPTIFVLNPGCCECVSIGGHDGEEVITIVRRGDDGLFHLAY